MLSEIVLPLESKRSTQNKNQCSLKTETGWGQNGPSKWLTTKEAAEYLRTSTGRIHNLVSAGRLHPSRDGRRLLFNRHRLDRYLENNR